MATGNGRDTKGARTMSSPLYYKRCQRKTLDERPCNTLMTSQRRHGYDSRYIEHYCPECQIEGHEQTDSEWRPYGEKLDIGETNGHQ